MKKRSVLLALVFMMTIGSLAAGCKKKEENTVLGMDYPNMIKEEYYLKKVDFPIVQVDISTCQG